MHTPTYGIGLLRGLLRAHHVSAALWFMHTLDSEDPKKGGGERGSISMMGVWLLLTDLPFVHFDSSAR